MSKTLLLNAHFFQRHISMACLPTGIFMYHNLNRSLKQCKVTVRHVTVRWAVTVLSWQSGFSRHSSYQSYWWAFVTERGIMTFLFTDFTQILKSLALAMLHSLQRDATRLPSFRGCAVARIPLVLSGPIFLIYQQVVLCNRCKRGQTSPMEPSR